VRRRPSHHHTPIRYVPSEWGAGVTAGVGGRVGEVVNPEVPTRGRFGPPRSPKPVDGRRWRRAAFALFVVAVGTNVPIPLLLIYRDRLTLSPDVLTAVFGVYAIGLVPALFLAGPASDRFGRRTIVLPLVVLSGLTSLLLIAADSSLLVLFTGRFLQGAVSGAVFGVGTAWVIELSTNTFTAGRRAAVAMTAGFSLGALTSGLLAQYVTAPTTVPYLVHVVLILAALAAAITLPETVIPTVGPRTHGPLLKPGDRTTVLTVLIPLAICVYAFPSVAIAAVPLLVTTSAPPVLFLGVLSGLTLGTGALTAPLQQRLAHRSGPIAAALGAAGYALTTLGAATTSAPLLLVAALMLGAGGGLALASGLALTARLAQPGRRGALNAVFLGSAYLGFAAPYITAITAKATTIEVPLAVFTTLTLLLCAHLTLATRRGLPW
jgi:MFS family permease